MSAITQDHFHSSVECTWCPGCGNFGILKSMKQALVDLQLAPERVVMCTGIGQAPKLPHYLRINTFNGLHGREVTTAGAIRAAAPDLKLIVHAGEGGGYGEGGNHFLHAIRSNADFTLVIHDNLTYGLTKGQPSPTTQSGTSAVPLHPDGLEAWPLNPLALAISQSCSFVAQTSAAHASHMTEIFKQAIEHRGFSLVNVLQPCVTWDKIHTYAYYRENALEISVSHDVTDQQAALAMALNPPEGKIPLGVLYRCDRPIARAAVRPLREKGVAPRAVLPLFSELT